MGGPNEGVRAFVQIRALRRDGLDAGLHAPPAFRTTGVVAEAPGLPNDPAGARAA